MQCVNGLCLVAPKIEHDINIEGVVYQKAAWQNNSTISVSFSNDVHPLMQAATVGVARTWAKYANIDFSLTFGVGAIRVGTDKPGNYSHVGRHALAVPMDQPTMNLSVLRQNTTLEATRRVILHEFGHALGLGHEHLHSQSRIPWDREKVFAAYRKAGWSGQKIERALFSEPNVHDAGSYDRLSIMHYPVDPGLTTGGYSLPASTQLSEGDIALISKLYPKPN